MILLAGFTSVEVVKERFVLFFKIPLWMAFGKGAAAPFIGVASLFDCMLSTSI